MPHFHLGGLTYPNRLSKMWKISAIHNVDQSLSLITFLSCLSVPLLPCDLSLHKRLHIRVFNMIKTFVLSFSCRRLSCRWCWCDVVRKRVWKAGEVLILRLPEMSNRDPDSAFSKIVILRAILTTRGSNCSIWKCSSRDVEHLIGNIRPKLGVSSRVTGYRP